MVALGAIKQLLPIEGSTPFTGRITGIENFLPQKLSGLKKIIFALSPIVDSLRNFSDISQDIHPYTSLVIQQYDQYFSTVQ